MKYQPFHENTEDTRMSSDTQAGSDSEMGCFRIINNDMLIIVTFKDLLKV